MTTLSPLDRDILFLVFVGQTLSADPRLPLNERYQLAGHCLPSTRVRALQVGGLIRSTGSDDDCEVFELTARGRVALTSQSQPSYARPAFPVAARERLQPPQLG
jgi:hypothetical protein